MYFDIQKIIITLDTINTVYFSKGNTNVLIKSLQPTFLESGPVKVPTQFNPSLSKVEKLLINVKNKLNYLLAHPPTEVNLQFLAQLNTQLLNQVKPAWEIGLRNTSKPYTPVLDTFAPLRIKNLQQPSLTTLYIYIWQHLIYLLGLYPLKAANLLTIYLAFSPLFMKLYSINLRTTAELIKSLTKVHKQLLSQEFGDVEYATEVVLNKLVQELTRLVSQKEEKIQRRKKAIKQLPQDLQQILRLLKREKGPLPKRFFAQELGVTPITAYRKLKKLEELKLIKAINQGRRTRYKLSTKAEVLV